MRDGAQDRVLIDEGPQGRKYERLDEKCRGRRRVESCDGDAVVEIEVVSSCRESFKDATWSVSYNMLVSASR
jgi:hypothetical protein